MKTTAIILISVFVVATTIKTTSQELTRSKHEPKATDSRFEGSRGENSHTKPLGGGSPGQHIELNGTEGCIYVGENWPTGVITLNNGGTIDNYFLRYNILADQMQFVAAKDTLAFASPQEISTITFDGHTFVYEAFQCDNAIRQGYFELIEPGKNKLLLKRMVTYQLQDESSLSKGNKIKYLIDDCYFIAKAGKPASKVMCNRKSALTFLNDHKREIEEYLRITGNKVKTPADLKKLVAYYNALDEQR